MPKKLTYTEVKKYVEAEGYKLVSNTYTNVNTHIELECPIGHRYKAKLSNFRSGRRCPTCCVINRNERRRIPLSTVENIVKNAGYTLVAVEEAIKGKQKQLVVKCDKGHECYKVNFQSFKMGRRCPHCKYDKNRLPFESVKKNISKEGYSFIRGEYNSRKSKIVILCPLGHNYTTTYDSFLAGKRCPKCKKSKGERAVSKILSEDYRGLEFIEQYKVRIDNIMFRYDFCILHNNKKLFIEYDGQQHFFPIEAFGGEEGYKKQVRYDRIKSNYAGDNLLRIPYYITLPEVKTHINSFFQKHGVCYS